uniref:hypothetical protein n=1 Tax=Mycobacterium tuberculosis TaxID=1773 RepID=UPI003F776F7B
MAAVADQLGVAAVTTGRTGTGAAWGGAAVAADAAGPAAATGAAVAEQPGSGGAVAADTTTTTGAVETEVGRPRACLLYT